MDDCFGNFIGVRRRVHNLVAHTISDVTFSFDSFITFLVFAAEVTNKLLRHIHASLAVTLPGTTAVRQTPLRIHCSPTGTKNERSGIAQTHQWH